MNKKGDITFTQVVYAAIALVVLIVLIMIFTGQLGMLSGKFTKAGNPTESSANKVGWCLDTLTSGKQCEYELNCGDIASRLGGTVTQNWDEKTPPKTTDCSQPGQIKAFSTSDRKFCCIKV